MTKMRNAREKLLKNREGLSEDALIGYHPYVKVAVDWWAAEIEDGDNMTSEFLAEATDSKISKEQIEVFRKKLKKLLIMETETTFSGECQLKVDYFPDDMLSEAAKEAEIAEKIFPVDTKMYVSKNVVYVLKKGEKEILWKAEAEA